ncbi:MAG TPA: DUF4320 family protein [Bacillota bacterium]|nr:DUF4320 family protein [Bacillota bacterium]
MIKYLKNKRGEGYIDTVVGVLAAMMVIVLALNVFSFLTVKQDLDYFAKEMIDVSTTYGRTSGEANSRYTELCAETGLNPSYSFSGTVYFNTQTGKVQLGDTIKVTVSYSTYVRGLGVFKIPITLTATHSGLSQKYWK